ncbi:MAG: UV DNA damage repair endonuclease UvsE [Proteobacteria bacterium]|nr:UV DNA damage repair endonuclease UvsE [Pseudomonadota bacterium]
MKVMKIGYPCINYSVHGIMRTFRLHNFSLAKHTAVIEENLANLQKILEFNHANHIKFFRISSQIIPFASHPICQLNWQKQFESQLAHIGTTIQKNNVRISMHPDQFVVLNSPMQSVFTRSIAELVYHAEFLNLLGLNRTAKIQIHLGGVYQNKKDSMVRFCQNYQNLSAMIKERLVIENDDHLYSVQDCYRVYQQIKIPIIFDNLHHQCLNNGETIHQALALCSSTWEKIDGKPMVDYSEQQKGSRLGKHAEHLDENKFKKFLLATAGLTYDLMLEIKDKELSVIKAKKIIDRICQ